MSDVAADESGLPDARRRCRSTESRARISSRRRKTDLGLDDDVEGSEVAEAGEIRRSSEIIREGDAPDDTGLDDCSVPLRTGRPTASNRWPELASCRSASALAASPSREVSFETVWGDDCREVRGVEVPDVEEGWISARRLRTTERRPRLTMEGLCGWLSEVLLKELVRGLMLGNGPGL
jgi:hypothetical protein